MRGHSSVEIKAKLNLKLFTLLGKNDNKKNLV